MQYIYIHTYIYIYIYILQLSVHLPNKWLWVRIMLELLNYSVCDDHTLHN